MSVPMWGAKGRRTGATGAEPAGTEGAAEAPRSDATIQEVMSSLGATVGEHGTAQYVSKDAKTTCPMYVGLGQNGMGFKKWYTTRFLPRVWSPKETEGRRAREKKMLQLQIQARTSLLKGRGRASPDGEEEEEEESGEGESREPRSGSPSLRMDPETSALMARLADSSPR